MTQLDEYYAMLEEGAATAPEAGASSGRGTKNASAWFTHLLALGHAEIAGAVKADNGRLCHLYKLTARGRAHLARRLARTAVEAVD